MAQQTIGFCRRWKKWAAAWPPLDSKQATASPFFDTTRRPPWRAASGIRPQKRVDSAAAVASEAEIVLASLPTPTARPIVETVL